MPLCSACGHVYGEGCAHACDAVTDLREATPVNEPIPAVLPDLLARRVDSAHTRLDFADADAAAIHTHLSELDARVTALEEAGKTWYPAKHAEGTK